MNLGISCRKAADQIRHSPPAVLWDGSARRLAWDRRRNGYPRGDG